ncbi:GNAT family N-acetyltransferase [Yinghuangia sp. ASG 101]|uniref:GNAT family N-acetyltransferase n=1 Tax=Yinghuangia sp. ASG 101 TaxID=2896848 RepID=UPI001E423AB8|nr:GNAT family N-acetyltransferase [Yinghuangia sp. ASG 101]UGQ10637.1 GNAT family N-acetyltransferase [Yinghuangia sp. ASG 101]
MTTTLRPAPSTGQVHADTGDWYAICANGRPIGRLHLADTGRWGDTTGWIDHVEVIASRRRRGHGCVALLAAEEILRRRGCGRVAVEVPEGNLPVLRLAMSLGYVFDSHYLLARVRGGADAVRTPPEPPPGFTVSEMSPAEHDTWRDGARRHYVDILTGAGWSPRHAEARAAARLSGGDRVAHVLRAPDGHPAGLVWWDMASTVPGRAEVRAFWVPEAWRGHGHGTFLLRTAEHFAYGAGLGELGVELVGPARAARHTAVGLGYRTQSRHLGKAIL